MGRRFALLWAASSISVFGDGMRNAALPLLAASVSRSAAGVSLVTIAGYLPWLLFALVGGVLVDRYDRRSLMWRANMIQFAIVGSFAAWLLIHPPPLITVAVLALLLGCAETIFLTASTSILPTVVLPDQLEQANGRLQSSQILSLQFVGPLAGATIFAFAPGVPFAVDAVSFLLAGLLIRRMGSPVQAPRPERKKLLSSMGEGLRWLWRHPGVRLLAFEFGLAAFALQLGTTMLVLLVVDVLHRSQFVFGVVLAAGAAGGLLASITVPRLKGVIGTTWLIGVAIGTMGISLLAAGASTSVVLVAAMYATGSFGVVTWTIQATTLRQRLVPPALMGRVSSAYRLIGWGGIPLGAALSGALGTTYGIRVPLFAGGVLLLMSLPLVPKLGAAHRG